MKETFKIKKFRDEGYELIKLCNEIVTDYLNQGLRLTLRQLYYQLVTKNIITNEEKSYSRLSNVVSDARLAGLLDWAAIEDRIRVPKVPPEWDNIQDIIDSALRSYRLPRWEGQPYYVELWVEKDALAGVLHPLAHRYHITMMVNRGYSSQSAMYEASKRFLRHEEKDLVLLYLGDFDPSGEDMVRDIEDRLYMFGIHVQVRKVALTLKQVKKYNPPPNPAKVKDPRAADFISRYGASSWEVDAINPKELQRIIVRSIEGCVDQTLMQQVIDKEDDDKMKLTRAVDEIMQEK